MKKDVANVDLLSRRELEAKIAGPLIKEFSQEFGKMKTINIVERVIQSLARESGRQLAIMSGGNSIKHLAEVFQVLGKDDVLEQEVIEQDDRKLSINCMKCCFADMYDEINMHEFGYLLSCNRDFAMIEGFNPKIKLTRTQTIMEGADYCDFRFRLEESE